MAKSITVIVPLLLCLLLMGGCGNDTEGEREIDRRYMESGKFEEFNRESRREAERRAGEVSTLEERLNLLPECPADDTSLLDLPLTITEEKLESHPETSAAESCPGLNPGLTDEAEISLLGSITGNRFRLWLVLVKYPSVYRNWELIVATAGGTGSLSAFRTVGQYQHNLARDISTELDIRRRNGKFRLASTTRRKISYPIKQENEITEEVVVGIDGSILTVESS